MSRVYFNGVSQVSFNGRMLSFVLDDTYKIGKSEPTRAPVVELISELEAVEGVCRYLLVEIERMKNSIQSETNLADTVDPKVPSKSDVQLKLGPRLAQISFEHD